MSKYVTSYIIFTVLVLFHSTLQSYQVHVNLTNSAMQISSDIQISFFFSNMFAEIFHE